MDSRLFVETTLFTRLIEEIGDNTLLARIQNEILSDPEKGDVIRGTGGVRKIRVKKPSSGKRGGYRVIYLDTPVKQKTFLLTIYDKRMKIDLSEKQKALIKSLALKLKGE